MLLLLGACSTTSDTGSTVVTPTSGAPEISTTVPVASGRERIDDLLTRCPSAVDVAFVRSEFEIVVDADPTAPDLVCTESEGSADLTRLEERAVQALLAIEATEFEEPLAWTDLQVFEWLTETIDGVRFRDDIDESFCCDPDRYVNLPLGDLAVLDTDLWIDPQSGAGMLDLVALIVHEARHAEGVVHTCDDGERDETVLELGAWAAESILYRWYAEQSDPRFFEDPNRPGYYAEVARDNADRILETRFCGEGG